MAPPEPVATGCCRFNLLSLSSCNIIVLSVMWCTQALYDVLCKHAAPQGLAGHVPYLR